MVSLHAWFRNNRTELHSLRTSSASPIRIHLIRVFPCSNSQELARVISLHLKQKHCFLSLSAMYPFQSASSHGMYNAVWDRFKMANVQLSYNYWFSSQQSISMASNSKDKKKYKRWLNIIKKHLGKGKFLHCFPNSFPILENIVLFISSNKIHATKYKQAYMYRVSFSCYFCFLLFVSKSWWSVARAFPPRRFLNLILACRGEVYILYQARHWTS